MSNAEGPTLTDRQQYWLEQVKACEASGKTVAGYAAEQGLSAQAMYAGKKLLVRKGDLPRTRPPRFQRAHARETGLVQQFRLKSSLRFLTMHTKSLQFNCRFYENINKYGFFSGA
jgi:hypothetical protein